MSGFANKKGGTAGDVSSRPFSDKESGRDFFMKKTASLSKNKNQKGELNDENYTERQCSKRI